MRIKETLVQETQTPVEAREYKRDYNRGWLASRSPNGALERADDRNEPGSWYDGYYDYAAGREKWHLLYCENHDNH